MNELQFLQKEVEFLKKEVKQQRELKCRNYGILRNLVQTIDSTAVHPNGLNWGEAEDLTAERNKGVKNLDKYYPYIPHSLEGFVHAIDRVSKALGKRKKSKRTWNRKFIDVGCGNGMKPLIASYFFDTVYGIEIRRELVEQSFSLGFVEDKSEGRHPRRRIYHQDAFEHNYKSYDVIYFYCPIQDGKLMRKLEQKIFKEAKIGCFIISTYLTQTRRFPSDIKCVDTEYILNKNDRPTGHKNKYFDKAFDNGCDRFRGCRVYKKVRKK